MINKIFRFSLLFFILFIITSFFLIPDVSALTNSDFKFSVIYNNGLQQEIPGVSFNKQFLSVERITVFNSSLNLRKGSTYKLYMTYSFTSNHGYMAVAQDKLFIGNYAWNQWVQGTDDYHDVGSNQNLGNGNYYMVYGQVVQFTPTFDSQGFSQDFYFNDLPTLTSFEISRFDLECVNNCSSNQDVIDNDNKNTQDIINNNNNNTDKIIEENNKNFNSCRDSVNLFDKDNITENYRMSVDGSLFNQWGYFASSFIPVKPNTTYTTSWSVSAYTRIILYDSDKSRISNLDSGTSFTTTSSTAFLRFGGYLSDVDSIQLQEGSTLTSYEPYGKTICKNRLDNIVDEQNKNHKEAEQSRKNIFQSILDLPGKFLDMLLGLFIPKNLDFLNSFKESLSNKLGFIASVPIKLTDFLFGLATAEFTELDSVNFPSISIFGIKFWDNLDIDLSFAINILKPIKYITDVLCVSLCCVRLKILYHKFFGDDVS